MHNPGLSIIIPTLNEVENMPRLLDRLTEDQSHDVEIIVVDGGSDDGTLEFCHEYPADIIIRECNPQRARQLNFGAESARANVYYFVHADTLPPCGFLNDIKSSIKLGYDMGSYRHRFEGGPYLLKLNAFLTRFDLLWLRGGDQSLFIKRDVFDHLGGFRENMVIMEDFELLRRARKTYKFRVIQKDILISARKYADNHYFRVQIANLVAFNMFRYGVNSRRILNTYRGMLNYRH